ncbi:MAG: hypothetical protein JXA20_13605 [Spirochaetes bacterium]|nr:hypothetical protein [Spirochaetota bacterium]
MKYTMVKQFSNAALDNIFSFFFKFVDFFKVLYEAFWAFLEIWIALFLIFFNVFMYIYYLILFIIDRGSETGMPVMRVRRVSVIPSTTPTVKLSSAANPVPAIYGGARAVASSAASTVSSAMPSLRSAPSGAGAKRQIVKTVLEALSDFFSALWNLIKMPARGLASLFSSIGESREKVKGEERPKSLIDEYLREYEQKKRKA